ncbi:ubiquinone anaerobic biosynthesis accessory factor UbiT [Litoribrevibacter albus]|uniref:SCP2 domain-containing protein n=1 Tax=Litoribrevibacter albus TaxID=1473156 RepID=A0AA37S9V2_9GAMM|nr:SCP2 sterol-binding domain-containing protein [Litoribrevibacter albus]GLQ31972.1 SCP2 domain-containing protein [Litoribrevibacter albus]
MLPVKTSLAKSLISRLPTPLDIVRRPAYYAALPVRRSPELIQQKIIQKLMSDALKTPIEDGDFDCLIDRKVKINVVDADYQFCIGLNAGKELQVTTNQLSNLEPDTEIKLDSDAIIKILTKQVDPDTLFFQRRLLILGDMDLGHEVKNTLDAIEHESLPKLAQWIMNNLMPRVAQVKTWGQDLAEAIQYRESLQGNR